MTWKNLAKADPIPWLLASDKPWVQYRTLVDLLDQPTDAPAVIAARKAMIAHPQVQEMVQLAATWPGYPLKRHNDAKHPLHVLALLADLGLQADDPGIAPVIEAVLAHQSFEGPFETVVLIPKAFGGSDAEAWTWMLCDAPLLVYALARFGLADHPAVQQAINHLLSLKQDNGWRCAACSSLGEKFKGPGRRDDPCPYANLLMLRAMAALPDFLDSDAARTGAEMLLWHWAHRSESKLFLFGIGTDFRKLKYPLVWYDILHVTDTLSRFPFTGEDSRLNEMRQVILEKQDEQGRFTPESVWMAWKQWDFGQKREPSPWLTLTAWRIIKWGWANGNL
jgi:hypothetical protein